ncbi:MAG: hypothetical protein ACKO6N_26515 [Myxococcota bacterium]
MKELLGKGFDDLSPVYRRRLHNTQLVAHVIDPQTPYGVKFEIFKRINTGGTPLSAQEIRHCMSRERSRDFLKELAMDKLFIQATGGALEKHPRLADREVVLRFIAFCRYTVEDYAKFRSVDEFLGTVTQYIDHEAKDSDLRALKERFQKGMRLAYSVFGAHCFRKWPLDSDRRAPINRALVETFGPMLSEQDPQKVDACKAQLVEGARKLMTPAHDPDFVAAIAGSTGSIGRVRTRFAKVEQLIREVLS